MRHSDKLSIYKQVDIDARVAGASPHQLILLLFNAAIMSLDTAILSIEHGDAKLRSDHISRINSILVELRNSLDTSVKSDLPYQLDSLYEYMQRRVHEAHVSVSDTPLKEVKELLATIRSGWQGISSTVNG